MDKTLKSLRIKKLSGGIAGLIVLLVILIAVNVIIGGARLRKDLTQERLYTLSDGTLNVLKNLNRTVTLKFFFNASTPEVPAPLKTFAQQVEDLLREYQLAGKGRIVVEKYDPKPDSDAEDWANRYGLEGQSLGLGAPNLYLGLVAVSGDTQAAMPVIDPRAEQMLEYGITRMIHRVATPKKPVIGVMSPLPVLGTTPPPYLGPGQPRQQPQPPWVAFRDLQEDYVVQSVATNVDRIDREIDALVVVHPRNLNDRTLYAIDQYVLRGGRLLAFVDPFCVVDTEAPEEPSQPYAMPKRSSDLDKLFMAWGITYLPSKVVADLDAGTLLRGRGNQVERNPACLTLQPNNINRQDALTAPLQNLLMPLPGAFAGEGADGITVVPLVTTSPRADLIDPMMAQFDPQGVMRNLKGGVKKLNLAIRLQGKFKTAFPNGQPLAGPPGVPGSPPVTPPPPGAVTPPGMVTATNADHLAESKTTCNVILVGDVDMLFNDFTVQQLNFFGSTAFQPVNDNINLLANAIEQLAGSSDLIGIRCRGRSARPFTRVIALSRAAEERWIEQERALEEKLQSTQQRLDELQRQKDEKQRFILSAEQAKEVSRFREEAANCRRELKQVRRNLREGIESLGMKLKLINILLMPALVSVAGIGFYIARRSKSRV